MEFIAEFGFDIKQGKGHEFQEFLSGAESKIAAACPAGVEYVGTFAVIYSSYRSTPGIPSVLPHGELRLTGYAMAAAMKEDGDFCGFPQRDERVR